MWRRIEIRNYRSIEYAALDLAPFTLVVGPNGSGKSNFADAFVFARDIGVDASSAVERRGGISSLRRWNRTKPFDVTIDIRASKTKDGLDDEYVRHQFTIHSGNEGRWHFSRELIEISSKGTLRFQLSRKGNVVTSSTDSQFPSLNRLRDTTSVMLFARQTTGFRKYLALGRVRRFQLNPEVMRRPQIASDNPRLDESGTNIATALRRSPKAIESVLPIMQKIIPGLESITVEPLDRYLSLRFEQQQNGNSVAPFTGHEMSEGALRALGISVAAYQMVRDELLIIEEPEVSIHIGAAVLLFDVLKSASSKGAVLLTTHSADLLEAATQEEILVCRYTEGVTHIGPLADAQREIVRKGLVSLAEIMRSEPLRIEGEESPIIRPAEAK